MNYWKQFAEMLGLELEEEFSLIKSDGTKVNDDFYKISRDGLFYKKRKNDVWLSEPSTTLSSLLQGSYKVVHKPWKLKVGEKYSYYSVSLNRATTRKWCNGNYDLLLWKFGNCFKTEKDANEKGKEVMEAIRKEYEEA